MPRGHESPSILAQLERDGLIIRQRRQLVVCTDATGNSVQLDFEAVRFLSGIVKDIEVAQCSECCLSKHHSIRY